MAKNKKYDRNDGRVTAEDLFGKLGQKDVEKQDDGKTVNDTVNDASDAAEKQNKDETVKTFDSIDVSEDGKAESDSDLDINELLRKYMPDYDDYQASPDKTADEGFIISINETPSSNVAEDKAGKGRSEEALHNETGFKFRKDAEPTKEDERLLNALDSAFGTALRTENTTNADLENESDNDLKELTAAFADDIDEQSDKSVKAKKKGKFAASRKTAKESINTFNAEEKRTEAKENDIGDSVVDQNDDYLVIKDGTEEEEIADAEPVGQTEKNHDEMDSTDMNLMVAFGLDDDDNKKSDRAKQLGDRLEAKQTVHDSKKIKLDRPELVDKSQIPSIRKEYVAKQRGLVLRTFLCTVLTLVLFIYENIPVLTGILTGEEQQFAGIFDPAVYPVVYIMVSLQLMLLACLCAYDQIIAGFKYLFRGVPRPESMTALLCVIGILYSAVLTRFVSSPNEPIMFNFVVALCALLTLVYAIFNNRREMMNLRIIASRNPKHIMRRLEDEESECEAKAFVDESDVCDVMKIEKTDFVEGFFGRMSKPDSTTSTFMTFVMSISIALAVIFGIVEFFKGGNAETVLRVAYAAVLVISPLSMFITFSYPFFRANLAAKEYDSAIIGEVSLEEYSNASIISFDDKNVFPSYSVKVQNIRIYNNARIDRVLYYASSAFAFVGGPLQDVFEIATKDMGNSNNVKVFDAEAGFLATQVDGVNIIFGDYASLKKRGLDIPETAVADDVDFSDELSIMYMFREDKLVAKMYIKYVMDPDIELILKQFSGSGLYVCVRTFDPNIDERMIARKANMKKMPLKIVRYASTDEVGSYAEKVNSGLVTCGTPKSLLQIISYCDKVLHTKKTNIALSVLSVMISAALLALLVLFDSVGVLNSMFIAVYQLIWIIPMTISSKMFIR